MAGVEIPHRVGVRNVNKYSSEFLKRPAKQSQEPLDHGQEPHVAVGQSSMVGIERC